MCNNIIILTTEVNQVLFESKRSQVMSLVSMYSVCDNNYKLYIIIYVQLYIICINYK